MTAFTSFGSIPLFQYGLILADPAVPFATYSAKGQGKSQEAHYPTMSWEEIGALKVGDLARGDALLWMWACWPSLRQSQKVMEQWGFEYVTGGSWHKLTRHGKSGFGTGYRLRSATEPFLIGVLGKPETAKNVRNVIVSMVDGASIDAERREHSRKPDDQYEMCEKLVPGAVRRLELFARTKREGWDCWGNETDKFAPDRAEVTA